MNTAVAAVSSHGRRKNPVVASAIVLLVVVFIFASGIMAGALPFLASLLDMTSLMNKWVITLMMLGAALGSVCCVIAWEA
ncbi:MAG: hypothetical protein ACRYHA_28000 [Janthinobacterium lividum]